MCVKKEGGRGGGGGRGRRRTRKRTRKKKKKRKAIYCKASTHKHTHTHKDVIKKANVNAIDFEKQTKGAIRKKQTNKQRKH